MSQELQSQMEGMLAQLKQLVQQMNAEYDSNDSHGDKFLTTVQLLVLGKRSSHQTSLAFGFSRARSWFSDAS
jgi:hypothetical protein